MYAFLRRLTRRRDVADDLFQETWMKLARSAHRLDADTDLRAWIFRVARNAFISHARWSLLDVSRLVVLEQDALPSPPAVDTEERTDVARRVARLEEALATLPLGAREVLLLVCVEGLTQEQAVAVLGVSYEALRQRLARARARLAKALEPSTRAKEVPA